MEDKKEAKFKLAIDKEIQKKLALYLVFAALMIVLNLVIQQLNELIAPTICENLGHIDLVQTFYCVETPDMSELVGTVVAVGITIIIKFLLILLILSRIIYTNTILRLYKINLSRFSNDRKMI